MLTLCFNRFRLFGLFLVLMAGMTTSWGQLPGMSIPYRMLGVNDGLPSDVVYHAMQDSKGFMWFCTETGVARFNGLDFENFSTRNGLADNETFQCFEDSKGRIWFSSFNGRFSFYQNGEFHNAQTDTLLARMEALVHGSSSSSFIGKIYEDPQHNLWFSFRFGTLLKLTPDNRTTCFFKGEKDPRLISWFRVFQPLSNGDLALLGPTFAYTISPQDSVTRFSDYSKISEPFDNGIPLDSASILMASGWHWGILDLKTLTFKTPLTPNPYGPLYFMRWDKGQIWASTTNTALHLDWDGQTLTTKNEFLHNHKISWVMQDQEGNTWVCTLGEGLYFIPTFKVFQMKGKEDELVRPIATLFMDPELGLMAGMDQNNIALIRGQEIDIWTTTGNVKPSRGRTKGLFRDERGLLWLVNENYLAKYEKGKIEQTFISVRSMIQDRVTKNYILITATAHYELSQAELGRYLRPSLPDRNEFDYDTHLNEHTFSKELASHIFQDSQNRIWVGGGGGLFLKKGNTLEKFPLPKDLEGQTVSAIAENQKGEILVGIAGNGLLILGENQQQRLISTDDGLSSNFIKHIYVDQHNHIYLATTAGINLLRFGESGKVRVSVMNMRDGLASNSTMDILRRGDTIYVASVNGLNFFHQEELFQNTRETPPLMLRNREASPEWQSHIEHLVLAPNQKLAIDFASLSFRFAETMRYRYKIEGIDTSWQLTQANHLEFPVLPAGDYTFVLQASFPDSDWPEKYASIQFTVQAFLYQKWWFWATMSGIAMAILMLGLYLRQTNIRERRFLVRRADENRQIALRSQMNPHFIFNSLNSLQRFILQNDTDSAYDYTTQFSRLVRAVLENSMLPTISLDREIETLRLYLKLESIRFDHRFHWQIEVSPEIPSDKTTVPPTLIQPFVENAIWHGLMPREGAGTVKINIWKTQDLLHFRIEDDGIGREKSAQIHKNKNRMGTSSGIKITEERIRAQFGPKAEGPFLQISDVHKEGEIAGTRVEFQIPFSTLP